MTYSYRAWRSISHVAWTDIADVCRDMFVDLSYSKSLPAESQARTHLRKFQQTNRLEAQQCCEGPHALELDFYLHAMRAK